MDAPENGDPRPIRPPLGRLQAMSGQGRGRRLGAPGERTIIVRVGMPEGLVQRIDATVAESIPKIDRSKWIVAQILAALPPPEDGGKTSNL